MINSEVAKMQNSAADYMASQVVLNRQWADKVFRPNQAKLPFSFVYGGRPSQEFIHDWHSDLQDDALDAAVHRRTLILTDPVTHLEVKAVCTIYLDTPGIDWIIYLTNKGDHDTPVIEQFMAVDATDQCGDRATLHRLNGSMCAADDWMPFDQSLTDSARIDFATTAGRASNVSPWFNVEWSTGGVITAIGWAGQWCASVELRDGSLHTCAGQQSLHTVLHPGESIRSPRIMQLRWNEGDQYRACNLFRRTMMAHILPRLNGQLVVPPIVHLSTAFYEMNATTEENVLQHLRSIAGLGFEMFWLDAYWTGPGGFPNSMGNYGFPIERVEPLDRFPHGLASIGQAVADAGLGFVMWFEPERVAAGTLLTVQHPEWIISTNSDGSGLLNIGIPAARQYMTAYLNAVIKAYRISCLRIDYNIDPLPYWQQLDSQNPERAGMAEMRYVEGLYRMWDDILAVNPSLFIDNCASGGRRIELETMSRSIPLWRSDNTCDMVDLRPETVTLAATKNQLMSSGLNRYVPFSTCGQMGASPYLFRSGFNAGIAFAEDIRQAGYPRDLLQQGIAEGKRIRKYFYGDFYPLVESGADQTGWCVMQYHRAMQNDGMLMVFRRDQSPATQSECVCHLRDIDRSATYRITLYREYEPESTTIVRGSDLQELSLKINDAPGSVILEYKLTAS
jgi:alpha-galactosidase